jgi:hypothetical protein
MLMRIAMVSSGLSSLAKSLGSQLYLVSMTMSWHPSNGHSCLFPMETLWERGWEQSLFPTLVVRPLFLSPTPGG